MAKRISDVERMTAWFQSADEGAANVMLQVIKGILAAKFGTPKKTRGPNKKRSPPAQPSLPAQTDLPS